ncbi:aminotransferase class IV family protein [Hydrogenimonas sp.]
MLIETIRIQNGSIMHLGHHQARLERSQRALFDDFEAIDLRRHLRPPASEGLFKCRVLYGPDLLDIAYEPYRPRRVRTLRLVESELDYSHKYSDREALDALFARRGDADEVLIVKRGLVTDTSIANVAFLKKGRWYTPRTPLLAGTTRSRLLQSGFLTPREIPVEELGEFEAIALLNAMIGFRILKDGKIV